MSDSTPPNRSEAGALPIVGLALSVLWCVPLAPLLGLVLSIIATVKLDGRPGPGYRMAKIGFFLAIFGCLGNAGLWMTRDGIYHWIRHRQGCMISEPADKISEIYRSAGAYYTGGWQADAGPGAGRFPESVPLTPSRPCCEGPNQRCPGYAENELGPWDHPTWQALNFRTSDPHRFQFEFVSDGTSFTARAIGDLDCDGVYSTHERMGFINDQGDLESVRGIRVTNECE